jgi:hypothetical protein
MPTIPYLLISDVDPATYIWLQKLARTRRKSVSDIARELLLRHLREEASKDNAGRSMLAARKPRIKVRRI